MRLPFRFYQGHRASSVLKAVVANEVPIGALDRVENGGTLVADKFKSNGVLINRGNGQLVIGSKPLTGTNDAVDTFVKLGGGVMTIFQGNERVQTTALKPDGTRAVGTKLAAGPIYDAIFKEGKSYLGETVVAETAYFGAYNPIVNRKGETLGILFAGMNKAEHMAVVEHIRNVVIGLSLAIGLLLAGKGGALAAGIGEGVAGRFDEAHGSLSIRIFGGKRLDLGLDAAQIGDFLLVARCLGPLKIVGKA